MYTDQCKHICLNNLTSGDTLLTRLMLAVNQHCSVLMNVFLISCDRLYLRAIKACVVLSCDHTWVHCAIGSFYLTEIKARVAYFRSLHFNNSIVLISDINVVRDYYNKKYMSNYT